MSPRQIPAVELTAAEQQVSAARIRGKQLGCQLILCGGLDASVFKELSAFLGGLGAEGLRARMQVDQQSDADVEARLAELEGRR